MMLATLVLSEMKDDDSSVATNRSDFTMSVQCLLLQSVQCLCLLGISYANFTIQFKALSLSPMPFQKVVQRRKDPGTRSEGSGSQGGGGGSSWDKAASGGWGSNKGGDAGNGGGSGW